MNAYAEFFDPSDWPFHDVPEEPDWSGMLPLQKATGRNIWKAKCRQYAWLRTFERTESIKEACLENDISMHTYKEWRKKDPKGFAAMVDYLRRDMEHQIIHIGKATKTAMSHAGRDEFKHSTQALSFAQFRKKWFKTDTPAFQEAIVEAYENTEPGKITMILIPPEHGKTTLFEDYAAWKLAVDPAYRFTIGSESQSMSRKILKRVQNRLDPEGPFPNFVEMFGPFVPQTASSTRSKGDGVAMRKTRQPWGQDYFSVYKKATQDERDYSMVALGIGSQIAGTRTDHLHIDDVMSMNNLSQAQMIIQVIRQDWLTRPGQRGRTTINGTRVGIQDVYELFEEELDEDLLTIIRMPAIITKTAVGGKVTKEPLWPMDDATGWGWTMDMLDRQRRLVGDSAWERNYMQKPTAAGEQTFDREAIDVCRNPLRSVTMKPNPDDGPLMIGMDPSIGGVNCTSVVQANNDQLKLIDIREDIGLASNRDLAHVVESLILKHTVGTGNWVSDLIIEEAAFQKGMLQDDSFLALRKKYGFSIRGHQTGSNKYDQNFGVASMVHHMVAGRFDFPDADDVATQSAIRPFLKELEGWRPYKRGTRLKQDRVMALWFAYIPWMQRIRASAAAVERKQEPWAASGLGYSSTQVRVLTEGAYA